jgi:hypothetical protein
MRARTQLFSLLEACSISALSLLKPGYPVLAQIKALINTNGP